MRLWLILTLAGLVQAPTFESLDQTAFNIGSPITLAELDLGKLKGELHRIAWSPDGASIYIQTRQGTDAHHFVVSIAGDRKVVPQPIEPEWAVASWRRKSSLTAPGAPRLAMKIMKDAQKRASSYLGGAPNLAGSIERELTPEFDEVLSYNVYDEQVGNWVRELTPGEAYGWGPDETGLVAFVNARGQILLRGPHARQMVPDLSDALLPAWSDDGTTVAFVQKMGRKRYRLACVSVK